MAQILRHVEDHGEKQLRAAHEDDLLGDPDWQEVDGLSSLDVHHVLKRYSSLQNIEIAKSLEERKFQDCSGTSCHHLQYIYLWL